MIRTCVAIALLLLGLAGGSSGEARSETRLAVRMGVVTISSQMAFDIAAKLGLFAKRGFDVEIIPLASGAQANQALAAGQVDWSAGGMESTIVATSNHLPFKPYAMYAKGGDSLGILVRKDANIKTGADLKGKRVAVSVGTASAQGLSQFLKANGLREDDVRKVNASFGTMGNLLVQGAVDVMVGLEPFLTVTEEKMGGEAILLTRLGQFVQGGGFFLISDAWAAAHPDRIEPAVEALAEAQAYIRAHPAEAAKMSAAFVKADAGVIERSSKVFDFSYGLDPYTVKSLKTTSTYLSEEKIIPAPVDVEKLLAAAETVTKAVHAKRPDL